MTPEVWARKFWARVDKNGPVPAHAPELGPCWVWTGQRTADGYGLVSRHGRKQRVSRVALEMKLGRPLRPGMQACHTCDNPPCMNGPHLFEGTGQENVADRDAKGRQVSPRGIWNGAHTRPERRARGESNGRARLTAALVRRIRAGVAGGRPDSVIAAEIGVSPGAVYCVRTGRTWSHVS